MALLLGIAGACRVDELVKLMIYDIEDKNNVLLITIRHTKTNAPRKFCIVDDDDTLNSVQLYKKYIVLRPPNIQHKRLFIFYAKGKCTGQPVGKNTLAKIPCAIATYLKLDEPKLYTGQCYRRSSATLLVDAGASMTTLKRHGGWKSATIAEGYLEDSIAKKKKIAKQILTAPTANTIVTDPVATVDAENMSNNKPLPVSSFSTGPTSTTDINNFMLSDNILGMTANTNLTFTSNQENHEIGAPNVPVINLTNYGNVHIHINK